MSVAQCVRQQETAEQLQRFCSDHHGWLYGWLRKKLGCAHNAADVAHDTFLRIIASRDALLGIHEPRAYLTTTAKRAGRAEALFRRTRTDADPGLLA